MVGLRVRCVRSVGVEGRSAPAMKKLESQDHGELTFSL